MGEACSLRPGVEDENNIMIDLRIMDDIDYFVVMACWYFNYYLCYLCMLSIVC
jgi:hypothetical protein